MKNRYIFFFLSFAITSCNKEEETTNNSSSLYVPTYVATVALVGEMSITTVSSSSATFSSTIINDGQTTVTSRGVCYGTEHAPTTSDLKTNNGSGIGTFTSTITGLNSGTTYYVRAYATNNAGTAYGDEVVCITN